MLGTVPGTGAAGLISQSPLSQGIHIPAHVYMYGGSSGWRQVCVLIISDSDKDFEKQNKT